MPSSGAYVIYFLPVRIQYAVGSEDSPTTETCRRPLERRCSGGQSRSSDGLEMHLLVLTNLMDSDLKTKDMNRLSTS
jgi:hypothetical protein